MISAIARKRMLFLRVSIISLALLSYFFIEFRAFTLELSVEQSLQFSVIGFILLIFGFDRDQQNGRLKTRIQENHHYEKTQRYTVGNIKQVVMDNLWKPPKP